MSSNNDLFSSHMSQTNDDDLSWMIPSDTKGPVLSIHNLCYEVKEKRGFIFSCKTTEKRKLSDINGIMEPGLNAIMGPSGAGKSLLLKVLAARKDTIGLSGDVWVHEVPKNADFQHISGYVVQDYIMMSTLTVRENIWFSASLRLPTTISTKEKDERINKVIEKLGLNEAADCKVESQRLRKMTSIGMELIRDFHILFLDEPTTGLDWNTANNVVRLLESISKKGRTIIFTIHHPPHSIFKLFDSLTLLASGKLMFHGPAQEIYGSKGYYDEHDTIAEAFFLDVITGIMKRESEDHEAYETKLSLKREESVIERLAEDCAKYFTTHNNNNKQKLEQLKKDQKKRSFFRKEITYVTPFGHQLRGITRRSFQNLVGHPKPWIAQITATFILGLVVGVTFLWLKNDCTEIQIRAGVLFFLMAYQCFSGVSAVELFVVQKQLFIHETISGYYSLSSYFFGNILSDVLSRRFLPSFIFTCILYFMVGSKPAVEAFFIMIFTLMMVACSSISMSLAIGANHSDVTVTTRVMDAYFIFTLIFLGVSLYFGNMASQILWLQYFSIPYYGFTALQHNEFLGRHFCSALSITNGKICPNYIICSGEEFLEVQNIDLSPWGLWKNHVALAIFMIIFLIIAYLRMLFLRKYS